MIKLSNKQVLDYQEDKKDTFLLKNDRLFFDFNLNGKINSFIFDTGAPSSLINYNEKIVDKVTVGYLELPDGTKIENNLIALDTFSTHSLSIKNAVFRNIYKTVKICDDDSYDGIFGVEFFNFGRLNINFDHNYIEFLSENAFNKLKAEYIEIQNVEYDDTNYNFIFPLKINENSVLAIFDTGNNGGIYITKEAYVNLQKEKEYTKIGFVSSDVSGENKNDTLRYFYSKVYLNKKDYMQIRISSNNKIKRNLAGVKFLKNFNWILDYNNEKLYYYPRKVSADSLNVTNQMYKVMVNEKNELYISAKDITDKRFALGAVIYSINDTIINSSNVCAFQKNLNNNTDWKNVKMQTKP